jgi:anaerobic selenocysteine-containing dehydrogenase
MCHEPTSVGLPPSIGVGKGTVLLEDFDRADCILIFGQNPGTNSPRMMTTLWEASRRGASIISFNPFRERALERFQHPQSPVEMATLGSTPISSRLFQVRVGGDVAVLKGIMKVLVETDEAARANEQPEVLDWDFIRGHTLGIEALTEDVKATEWADICRIAIAGSMASATSYSSTNRRWTSAVLSMAIAWTSSLSRATASTAGCAISGSSAIPSRMAAARRTIPKPTRWCRCTPTTP